MGMRVNFLASGSSGNSALIETDSLGVLIDIGLGPRQLADRFRALGTAWTRVQAAVLTHTHSDHWKDGSLSQLLARGIPLYCHPGHHQVPQQYGAAFRQMLEAGLVRSYQPGEPIELGPGLRCTPLPVSHDSGPTFGFRFESGGNLFEPGPTLGYVADLGTWDDDLVESLRDVDVLAVEFNHDVEMEANSGRRPMLVARVLGDQGHLSNDQGAALVRAIVQRSRRPLRHLVLLHLSEQCNRPALARSVAEDTLADLECAAEVHVALQQQAGPALDLALPGRPARRNRPKRPRAASTWTQQLLPGLE